MLLQFLFFLRVYSNWDAQLGACAWLGLAPMQRTEVRYLEADAPFCYFCKRYVPVNSRTMLLVGGSNVLCDRSRSPRVYIWGSAWRAGVSLASAFDPLGLRRLRRMRRYYFVFSAQFWLIKRSVS